MTTMIRNRAIRPAHPRDSEQIARTYVASWRATYQGILPSSYLAGLSVERSAYLVRMALSDPQSLCLIAEEGHGVVGYAFAGPERTHDPVYRAELYDLYLLPEVQRQGLGKQLLAEMARRLDQARFYALRVWVLALNPSRHFYEKRGGIYLGSKSIVFAGRRLQADSYGWIDITLAMENAD